MNISRTTKIRPILLTVIVVSSLVSSGCDLLASVFGAQKASFEVLYNNTKMENEGTLYLDWQADGYSHKVTIQNISDKNVSFNTDKPVYIDMHPLHVSDMHATDFESWTVSYDAPFESLAPKETKDILLEIIPNAQTDKLNYSCLKIASGDLHDGIFELRIEFTTS